MIKSKIKLKFTTFLWALHNLTIKVTRSQNTLCNLIKDKNKMKKVKIKNFCLLKLKWTLGSV